MMSIRLQHVLTCSLLLLVAAPIARAQSGPGSEIALTLSYTDLDAEFDADAFGFDLGDVDDFTALDNTSGIAGELRFTRAFFLKQLRIGSAISVALFEEEGEAGPDLFDIDGDEQLLLITPELQL